MQQKRLEPGWDWVKKFGFAPGIRVGDTIHTCGMIAFGPDGNLVGEGDCYAQAMQVYQNIAAVLALEGASMADIVKTTTWLPDMSSPGLGQRPSPAGFLAAAQWEACSCCRSC